MLDKNNIINNKVAYSNVFVADDRILWEQVSSACNKESDLILCLDFGLFNYLRGNSYSVAFLDHLTDSNTLETCNSEMNRFFQNWFKDAEGNDLLCYQGLNIGDALLLNVLNEITNFSHLFFNLIALKEISYNKLFIRSTEIEIQKILNLIGIDFTLLEENSGNNSYPVYNFPISKWIDEQINKNSLKHKFKDLLRGCLDKAIDLFSLFQKSNKKTIFVQHYHPTKHIIELIYDDGNINVILENYIKNVSLLKQKRITYKRHKLTSIGSSILNKFKNAEKQQWNFQGIAIGDYLYNSLEIIVENNINKSLSIAESIIEYFSDNKVDLMIPVTNLWLNNRLIMNYCKNNGIPVFMIINGLLNVKYWKDGHDSDYVNCYSESIKNDYFENRDNVIPLGDVRMDQYARSGKKVIDRETPTITIGAAGFDNIDLNSYVAFEFDFLYDTLSALDKCKEAGLSFNIILKVRANGYAYLYQDFVDEYYPQLSIKIEQTSPFFDIIKVTDLYISFYSQTILEASSIGVPAIYFKKDTQNIFRPFDGKSELVTCFNTDDLVNMIGKFYKNDEIFDAFLERDVIERYIGPLDGKNLTRNIDFINGLLQ